MKKKDIWYRNEIAEVTEWASENFERGLTKEPPPKEPYTGMFYRTGSPGGWVVGVEASQ